MTLKETIQVLFYLILLSNVAFGVENIDDVMKEFKQRELTQDSLMYPIWIEPEIPPVYKRIYLYHVTNPDAILEGNKPKFQEMGPYVYKVHTQKMNVSFSSGEGTVTYDKSNWYEFLPDKSSGSLDDVVTVLNAPYFMVANQLEGKLTEVPRQMMDNVIEFYNVKPFINQTVMEMLFKGYRDKYIAHLGHLRGHEILTDAKYGYYYGQNFATEGYFTVYTGLTDKNKFLLIQKVDGKEKLSCHTDGKLNEIESSSEGGCVFKPNIETSDTLQLYTTDLCRALPLKYEGQEDYLGVKVYRFTPELKSYCSDETNKPGVVSPDFCGKGGIEKLSMLSFPHFYQADASYLEAVEGLNPDKAKHGTYFDVEPTVGVTMHMHKRLQLNIAVKPLQDTEDFKNFPELVFPLTWYDETAEWPEDYVVAFNKVE